MPPVFEAGHIESRSQVFTRASAVEFNKYVELEDDNATGASARWQRQKQQQPLLQLRRLGGKSAAHSLIVDKASIQLLVVERGIEPSSGGASIHDRPMVKIRFVSVTIESHLNLLHRMPTMLSVRLTDRCFVRPSVTLIVVC